MITQMEIASGEILNLIDEKERPISFREIKSHLGGEAQLTDMSINWLVLEGYVQVIDKGSEKYLLNTRKYT